MADGDWTALVTESGREFLALTELQRYGCAPYLPQIKRRWSPRTGGAVFMRSYPLFPRYLLIPIDTIDHQAIRLSRGIIRTRPILADADGNPFRAPATAIEAVRAAEAKGAFDEIPPREGDKVKMRHGVFAGVAAVVGKTQAAKTLEVLLPLFNSSVRAMVGQSAVMRT